MKIKLSQLRRIIKEEIENSKFDAAWLERINFGGIEPLVQALSQPGGAEYTTNQITAADLKFPLVVYHAPIDENLQARYWAWTTQYDIAKSFMDEVGAPEKDIMKKTITSPDEILAFHPYEGEVILRK